MTKAAVRAMDALQEMSQQEWENPIETFVIGGASKRGWTTWFTGQVDERVIGIAPMVYDNLNLAAQMRHQIHQWGAYSPQIDDYTSKGLPDFIGSEAGRRLAEMVDPYTYRDRATMPKLIVAGTNDPYWPLGAANDYFADLVGPKYLLYAPNSGHGLDDRVRVIQGVAAFAAWRVVRYSSRSCSGASKRRGRYRRIVAHSEPGPERVLLWTARSDTGDFRPSKWVSEELEAQRRQVRVHVRPPMKVSPPPTSSSTINSATIRSPCAPRCRWWDPIPSRTSAERLDIRNHRNGRVQH